MDTSEWAISRAMEVIENRRRRFIIYNFNQFLKVNNAFDSYYFHVNQRNDNFIEIVHERNLFGSAFTWSNTLEGYQFWAKLSIEWTYKLPSLQKDIYISDCIKLL